MTESSKLWEKLTRREFSNIDDDFLKNFRAPGSANRFVAWDPYEQSARYLKFLLFTVAQKQPDTFFDAYKKLSNCSFGNPLSVRYADCDINADYLAAVEEWIFLSSSGGLEDVNNIVEIGAGFGRTCHTILTLCPWLEEYTIIDLEPMLDLSSSYLKQVAPDLFNRIRFISSNDNVAQEALTPDLAINIDSFQEMPATVIDGYMKRVVQKAHKFYCKNPVGKYLPCTVGLPDLHPGQLMDVFKLGYCESVIDIFNDRDLQEARVFYLEAYSPPSNQGVYSVTASKVMELFPYFHHALYVRKTST
jgi:putative sugar O-methyltransferase